MPDLTQRPNLHGSLMSRIATNENQERFEKTSHRVPTLRARLRQPTSNLKNKRKMRAASQRRSQQDDNDSSLTSETSVKERSLESRLSAPYSRSLNETPNSPLKRKTSPSDFSTQKSTRPRLELNTNLPALDLTSKPSLLSRIDLSQDNPRSLTQMTEKTHLRRNDAYTNPTCLGAERTNLTHQELIPSAPKPSNSFESTTKTSKSASSMSVSPPEHQTTSHLASGSESLKENPSTLTKSSLLSTGLQLLKTGRHALERQRYHLDRLRQLGKLQPLLTGRLRGDVQQGPQLSYSHTEIENSKTMPNTLKTNLPPKTLVGTTESSYTMSPSGIWCEEGNKSYSPIRTASCPSTQQSSYPTESSTPEDKSPKHGREERSAIGSMTKGAMAQTADIDMPARSAEARLMERPHVMPPPGIETYGMRPKYHRYNIWDPDCQQPHTTAEWTEHALPLPRPSPEQLMHPISQQTIATHADLFQIITPIKIEVFEDLLQDHPNQPFVKSVCDGLRYGFWPWADIWQQGYPESLDLSQPQQEPSREKFLSDQRNIEVEAGRYTHSIGPTLLPGMYCMPIYAVPKPHSDKLRLVNDHSASKFSLNSMVSHEKVTGYPMDNLAHYGEDLVDLHRERDSPLEPDSLVGWKSDISLAYRICPLHPIWQLKQGVRIGNDFHIDRCITFGSSASPAIFIAFNSLVTWIAKYKRGITFIITYLDDSSGCTWKDDVSFYGPYHKFMPSPQARLLTLWDDLGIPHDERKQISGPSIPIIGIQVNPNELSYTLPEDSHTKLLEQLQDWASLKKKRNVRSWQQLAGWINWCLNVFPHVRPALCNIYDKLRSQHNQNGALWINNAVRDDLRWALDKVKSSPGLLLLETASWSADAATHILYCDACPTGMGFWYPDLNVAFYSDTPPDEVSGLIFYFEALCVLCALRDACHREPSFGRFILYTDNQNSVDIYSTLRAMPAYNALLREAVDLLTSGNHDMRVLHVPGDDNSIADALSQGDFSRAINLRPQLAGHIYRFSPYRRLQKGSVYSLQPPREPLGAEQK
jgi:hypothetical protein